jgi:hypothetical protein
VDGRRVAYVEQKLALCAILRLLFQKDVANRVNDQNFAVLRNDALLGALRTRNDFGLNRRANTTAAGLLHGLDLFVFDSLLLHGTLLTTVPWDILLGIWRIFRLSRLGSSDRSSASTRDALDGRLVTPGSLARMADVSFDEFPAALVRHGESKVVHSTTHDDQHTDENRAEAWAEASIVISRAPPCGKAVAQEVIVALALRTLEDVGDDGQTLITSSGLLEVRIDFPLGWDSRLLAGLLALFRIAVDEDLAGLVGVQFAGALAVGLGQVVLGGAGLDAEQVVKGDIGTLCGSDLIAEAEDFMVCGPGLAQLLLVDGPRGACAQPGE